MNPTTKELEFPATIPDLLRARVEATPEMLAFGERDTAGNWNTVRWLEVWSDVQRLAKFLQRSGLQRGDRFVVVGTPSRKWETLHLAILLAGGTVVGIEPHASRQHIEYVLSQSEAQWWAVDNEQVLELVDAEICQRMTFLLLLNTSGHHRQADCRTWDDVMAEDNDTYIDDCQFKKIQAADLATVIYTSGTTGRPKAIQYTHGQLMAACRSISEAFPQLKEGDTTLCWMPLAHLFQRMIDLVAIARGVSIYFVDNPHDVVECASEVQPAVFVGVPRFYEKLYDGIHDALNVKSRWSKWLANLALRTAHTTRVAKDSRDVSWISSWKLALLDRVVLSKIRRIMGSKIRFMITGSAPTPTHILEFFHTLGWPLLEAYGISENSIPMAANRAEDFRIGSVGKPLTANEIRFDGDGEILVRGSGVFSGYDCGMGSDGCLTDDGFYRTGDLGYLDEDGFLYLTGRKSEIIKTSTGRRLSPARIEAVYTRSGVFENVVVIGNGRKHLVALVVPNRERLNTILSETNLEDVTARELMQYEINVLGNDLAPYERIQRFVALDRPFSIARGELTPTLKLRRQRIERLYADTIDQLYETDKSVVSAVPVYETDEIAELLSAAV